MYATNNKQLMAQAYQRSNFGLLGRQATNKLGNDNDVKIIIQGANSQTGIGKTTLAIQLCRYIDDNWSAEQKAFVDVKEYINAHLDYEPGSALLLDEIEHGADNRRANSKENVKLSQAWATLRARNIATVCTLPSISMLDGRMLELADYWVLVKNRGLAQPFEINVNDFAPKRTPQRKPLPGEEHIQFVDLPDDDPDKAYLDDIKDEMVRSDEEGFITKEEHNAEVRKAKKNARQERRNEIMVDIYEHFDVTYEDIGNLPSIDLDRSTVYQRISDNKPTKD